MDLLFFDSETQRIGAGSIAPPMICGIFTVLNESGDGYETKVLGNHPDDGLEDMLEWMLTDDNIFVITQRGGFDYAVICRTFPRLIPLVYAKLIAGLASDTMWREKLLNLSTTGRLDNLVLPDGSNKRILYNMGAMAANYLGIDMSEEKDAPIDESWRANYGTLDGWLAADYPDEAMGYAVGDGERTGDIYFAQEARMAQFDFASVETEEFQIVKDFVLYMMSAWGMETDPEATAEMAGKVDVVMADTKDLLERSGILRGADRYGAPYAKAMDDALDLILSEFGTEFYQDFDEQSDDWTEVGAWLAEQGVKMKKPKGKVGSMNQAKLQAHLLALYKKLGEIPPMTDGGEGEPQIKCDAEVQEYLAAKCPVMEQYHQRMALGKIKNQMIPVLQSGPVVYPSYDAIKETGRTSSFDGGKVKGSKTERNYPSVNIQQIPNEIKGLDPRRCFRPRAGTVFFDVDFTGLELACVGHITGELFGTSVHRDLYNAGIDLHGYLGGQLGLKSSEPKATKEKPWLPTLTRDFQNLAREEGIISDPMAVYDAFKLLKTHEEKDVREFFKHFRSFAKPVGLGFPGGLGPATMVEFARKTYGVIMTEEEASDYREFWRLTYPEMPQFFDWINGQTDPYNGSSGDSYYTYTTPMGLVRRGASFCAAANGCCMQSPGAEAAMMGAILVSRACYDPTQNSILYGCRPIAFVHDQLIGETTKDQALWAAQCEEVARLMREGAEMVLHTITMRTDEALLTSVWTKAAEPVRDTETNELQVWRPAA